MLEAAKLNDLLAAPEGYRITDALFLTYSLSLHTLNELLIDCGIAQAYAGREEALPEHVLCVAQEDRGIPGESGGRAWHARLLNRGGAILKKKFEGSSVHPKLYAFLYEEAGGGRLLRLIVSSRNITASNYLEGAVCLEARPGGGDGGTAEKNGPLVRLLRALAPGRAVAETFAGLLEGTDFTDCVRSILDDGTAEYAFSACGPGVGTIRLPLRDAGRARAVSPFLGGWDFLRGQLGGCPDWKIITRREVSRASLPGGAEDGRFLSVPDPGTGSDADGGRTLHAKLYACTRGSGASGAFTSVFAAGSANFSENGFNRNYELLLTVTSRTIDFVGAVDSAFGTGGLPGSKPVDASDAESGREACELPDEGAPPAELIASIRAGRLADEMGRFLVAALGRPIVKEHFVDEFIRAAVNLDDGALGRLREAARACLARPDHDRCIDPYLEEIAGGAQRSDEG